MSIFHCQLSIKFQFVYLLSKADKHKTEYAALMRYLQKTDPHAFDKVNEMAYISQKKSCSAK